MTLGQKVKTYRENLGWSQDELSKKLGVSISTIGMIETDKRNIKDKLKYDLCTLFNISIAELMSDDESNFEELRNKIISIFLKYKTSKTDFENIINEVIDILENQKYLQLKSLKTNIESRQIISNIMQFFARYSNRDNLIADEDDLIRKNKVQLISVLESINYDELKYDELIEVYSQISIGSQVEESISKNFYNNSKSYIGIKILNDQMSPKYEKGNIAIVEKSNNFFNGQDVCFKDKTHYKIGRIFKQNDMIIIKYLNNDYSIECFNIDMFNKMYIGTVVYVQI